LSRLSYCSPIAFQTEAGQKSLSDNVSSLLLAVAKGYRLGVTRKEHNGKKKERKKERFFFSICGRMLEKRKGMRRKGLLS